MASLFPRLDERPRTVRKSRSKTPGFWTRSCWFIGTTSLEGVVLSLQRTLSYGEHSGRQGTLPDVFQDDPDGPGVRPLRLVAAGLAGHPDQGRVAHLDDHIGRHFLVAVVGL